MVTSYLDEWGVLAHLTTATNANAHASVVLNRKCVYGYLIASLSGQARTLVLAESVKQDCNLAWTTLVAKYDRHSDLDIEHALNEWYHLTKSPSETASEFITRMDIAADKLAKRGKAPEDTTILAMLRTSLRSDPRYRGIIEASIIDPNIRASNLRKIIFELDSMPTLESRYPLNGPPSSSQALHVQCMNRPRNNPQ